VRPPETASPLNNSLFYVGALTVVKASLTICFVPLDVKYDCTNSLTLTKEFRMHPRTRGRFCVVFQFATVRGLGICYLTHADSWSFVVMEFVNEGLARFKHKI
jgi:hypothetical protein